MRPSPGRRDTLITFQQRTKTKSASGALSYTWANLASNPTEWAEVLDILGSERASEGIDLANRPCRVRTLYRSDITSDMRITFEGRSLQIIRGPIELGRQEGLQMVCQDWSTEGETP